MSEYWCIPPKENAEFVACMEDILHIYSLPYNKELPVVCMDEKPYQLLGEAREPLYTRPQWCLTQETADKENKHQINIH